jgi:RHS repeat-associated protein
MTRRFLTILVFILSASYAFSQAQTGKPAFSTLTAGPDVINLGNLNLHLDVPVLNKAGRGLPFYYTLTYDGLIWTPSSVNGTMQWVNDPNWGWSAQTDTKTGYVTRNTTITQCGYYVGTRWTSYNYTTYRYYGYTDEFGTYHQFMPTLIDHDDPQGECFPDRTTGNSKTVDGSGYSASLSYGVFSLTARDGSPINAPISKGASSASLTDRNGNQVTTDGTNFYDTTSATVPVLSVSGGAPNPVLFTIPTTAGASAKVTVSYKPYPVQTAFNCQGINEATITNVSLVDFITLADGSSYHFTYEPTTTGSGNVTGRIQMITLPTGGTLQYSYPAGNMNCTDGTLLGIQRTTSPDGVHTEGTWSYSRTGSGTNWTTTATDQVSGNQTVLNFQGIYETHRDVYSGSAQAGVKKLSADTCYNGSVTNCTATTVTLPITSRVVTTTLDNGQTSQTAYGYLNTSAINTEQPVSITETDFGSGGPGGLLRKTLTSYNARTHKTSVTVSNGSGTTIAQTTYGYDETAPAATSGVPQHVAAPGVRDNVTSVTQILLGGTNSVTHYAYDDTGNVLSATDPNANITTYSYGNGNAYLTGVTMPNTSGVSHSTSSVFDTATGLKLQDKDQNGQITSYTYDSANRISSISLPDGGHTSYGYPSANEVDANTSQAASSTISTSSFVDGLGRPSKSCLSDPEGQVCTESAYNSLGQLASVTNPHRLGSSSTDGSSQYSYDVLGRATQVTLPDSNVQTASYSGPCHTDTDAAGRALSKCADALGRLASVTEPNASTGALGSGYTTTYTYDVLNNLTGVSQAGSQSRTFSYDSLSRLKSMQMPESGTTNYAYDAAGNMLTQTDARGITTTFSYDQLNRLLSKTYSDGTKSAVLHYDETSAWGVSVANGIGRLTSAYRAINPMSSATLYSYDAMGRVVGQWDCRPSNCGSASFYTQYGYDLAGDLTSIKYPSGRNVTFAYNAADALAGITLASVGSTSVNYPYITANSHYPSGAVASITYGNGVTDQFTMNSRQQATNEVLAGTRTWLNRSNAFYDGSNHNNGNLLGVANNIRGGGNQTFSYDYLNRLTSANQTDGAYNETYSYDQFGNMSQTGTYNFLAGFNTQTNQINGSGFSYDANGNLVHEGTTNHAFTYDAENHLATVDTTGATYLYGPDGLRHRSDVGSAHREFIYMGTSEIAEQNESGDWTDFVPVGNQGKIKAEGLDRGLHIYGTNCSSCGSQYTLFYFSNAGGLAGYQIRSGDKLYLTQYQQSGSKGGVVVAFSDGTNTNWSAKDTNGYYANDDQTQGTTHSRIIDLSSFAGKTVSQLAVNQETDTSAGAWAIVYEQMAFVSTDGTVVPLYTGQASSPLGAGGGSSGVTGRGSTVDINRNKAQYPNTTTTYYHTDGVGTSRLITQGAGWPVWQGIFAPFGQEISAQMSIDGNKFATYSHDDESNLEHAGFRKYSAVQGRFTTPDPYLGSADPSNPQSWNRYAFVVNNPLSSSDPLGLYRQDCVWDGSCGGWGGDGGGAGYYGGGGSPCTLNGIDTPCGGIGGGLGSNAVGRLPDGVEETFYTGSNGQPYWPSIDANGDFLWRSLDGRWGGELSLNAGSEIGLPGSAPMSSFATKGTTCPSVLFKVTGIAPKQAPSTTAISQTPRAQIPNGGVAIKPANYGAQRVNGGNRNVFLGMSFTVNWVPSTIPSGIPTQGPFFPVDVIGPASVRNSPGNALDVYNYTSFNQALSSTRTVWVTTYIPANSVGIVCPKAF